MKSSPGEWGFLALSFSCSFRSPSPLRLEGIYNPPKERAANSWLRPRRLNLPQLLCPWDWTQFSIVPSLSSLSPEMVFYSLEPCIEKAGRKAELPCFLPSTRGEETSQPIRSLLPLPFRSPQRQVGGRQPGRPLVEAACYRRGEAVTLQGWQLFPLPSRELEKVGSFSVCSPIPPTSH